MADIPEVPLGSGLAEKGRQAVKGRKKSIDAAIDAADPAPTAPQDGTTPTTAGPSAQNTDAWNKYALLAVALLAGMKVAHGV